MNQDDIAYQQQILQQLKIDSALVDIRAIPVANGSITVGVYNPILGGVTTANYVDIDNAGSAFDMLAVGTSFALVSDNAGDGIGSTGIQEILVQGVDNSFNAVQEVMILNGITAVNSTKVYLIVNSVTVLASGSHIEAVGNITATGAHNTFFKIVAGYSNAYISRIAVPAGYTYIFDSFEFSCSSAAAAGSGANVRAKVFPNGLPPQDAFLLPIGAGQTVHNSNQMYGALPEKTIFYTRAIGLVTASTVSCFSAYYKVPNTYLAQLQNVAV